MHGDTDHQTSYTHRVVGGHSIDVSTWPTPDEGALAEASRDAYFARKSAVLLFLQGAPFDQIRSSTGLGAKHIYRLVRERCLIVHEDGQPYGWRGLIPHVRIRTYKRHTAIRVDDSGGGGVGAMQAVLDQYPELRLAFERRISKPPRGNKLQEVRLTPKRHWIWFLDKLRRLGCEERGEWPFNTVSKGYFSVRRHVQALLASNPKALALTSGGPDTVR